MPVTPEEKTQTPINNSEFLHSTENVSEIFKAPRLAPESYPGDFPRTPCALLDGENLYQLRWNSHSTPESNVGDFDPVIDTTKGPVSLDDYLKARGLPTTAERYALTVFASNRCPGQLLDKFRRASTQTEAGHPDQEQMPELEVVPMFNGVLRGYDVVYNAKVGNLGYFFADLYQSPETADTEIEVAVLLLTREQLQIIHETEKQYDFKLLGRTRLGKVLDSGEEGVNFDIPAYAHVGKASAYANPHASEPQPVAVAGVHAHNRSLEALDQPRFQEMVFSYDPEGKKQRVFSEFTNDQSIKANSPNFIANMKSQRAGGTRKLSERKNFQELLNSAMSEAERITIDPDRFEATEFVELGKQPIPRLGEITVINFLAAQAAK